MPFSRAGISEELDDDASPDSNVVSTDEYLTDAVLHPYVGFTGAPRTDYNVFAFPGIDPILKRDPWQVNICLLGGSVARGLYGTSREKMISKLKTHPAFRDKEIRIALFALGGFKQPQELMALNYFVSQGAEYDYVILLDGFNEIVLPYADNLPFKVHPSYPRHWNMFAKKKLDTRVQLILARQALLKEEREQRRARMSASFRRYSNFGLFLWKMADNRIANEQFALESKLREAMLKSDSDFQSTGPSYVVQDTNQFFHEQAAYWAQCSRQMRALCDGLGMKYYHFLQPNQYVNGSKVFTEEEKLVAVETGPYDYKTAALAGYPMLIEEGKKLKAEGERFTDLTPMFVDERKSVYNDKCCHFNDYGYALIADRICEVILSDVH